MASAAGKPEPKVGRERLLELATALQRTLDLKSLLEIFSNRVRDLVVHEKLEYAHIERGIAITVSAEDPAKSIISVSLDALNSSVAYEASYELRLEDDYLGMVRFRGGSPFTPRDTNLLEALIANLMHPLRNCLMYRQALEAAARDPLTGVHNRTGLKNTLDREVELARRHGNAFSVLMMDADRFKRINDRHGHLAGDRVLKALAHCLALNIRESDMLFRYGGEEFCLIASNTTLNGALAFAERLREAVGNLTISLAEHNVTVTMSFGVACYRPDDTAENLLARADQALYSAKGRGRNQVKGS